MLSLQSIGNLSYGEDLIEQDQIYKEIFFLLVYISYKFNWE